FAGAALIASWKDSPLQSLRQCQPLIRVFVVLLMIAPIGFYFGVTDAYLAHNLYSSNTASAAGANVGSTWTAFNVPLPPEHRLYEQYFRLTCSPGDVLSIHDTRWWFQIHGWGDSQMLCPSNG